MTTLRGLCLLISFIMQQSAFSKEVVVPEPLKPWQEWVLYGVEEKLCPTPYNNSDTHVCVWPTDLQLTVDNTEAKFTQKVVNYVQGWVPLPGNVDAWPLDVKVNGKPAAVLSHTDLPAVFVDAGELTITGQFLWDATPDFLQLPANLGTLTLTVAGKLIDQAVRDQQGKVWFKPQVVEELLNEQADSLTITAFRLFQDSIPLIDNTFLRLKATGKVREVNIGPVLLKDSLPMMLKSPLPARIEDNGMLRMQVKPGVWDISIKSRFLGKQQSLALPTISAPWPSVEVWSFAPQNELRLVEIEQGKSIDPQQTDMPQAWKAYPSYLLEQGKSISIVEKRRGQEKQPSDLTLTRNLWLDFQGNGFIAQDVVRGNVNDSWRLQSLNPFALKRVTIDGQDKLITQIDANSPPGVEVRQGHVNLTAVSRVADKPFKLPAVGWDFNVRQLSTILYLPPGFKLIGAWGADTVTHAWVQEWTLLDLFLVLIMAAAVAKLLGLGWGLITLVTMILTYREVGAPIYSWLNLIAALALYKVLPQGQARKLFLYYSRISFVVLAIVALPFMIKQIREAIYPQLTAPNQSYVANADMQEREAMQNMVAVPQSPRAAVSAMGEMASKSKSLMTEQSMDASVASGGANRDMNPEPPPLEEYDANAKIQTGPGIPTWKWDVAQLIWNGPVLKEQKITLWILPSFVISILKFLQVGLMFGLFYGLTRIWDSRDKFQTPVLNKSLASLSMFLISGLFCAYLVPGTVKADMPDKALLEELKARLTRAPECIPECAEISRMQIDATENQLTIRANVALAAKVALPIPSSMGKWMPRTVMVNGVIAKEMQMEEGSLWLQLSPGVHEIVLEGPIGAQDKFEIFVPLKPKWVKASANGWSIDGIFRNQLSGENFYLTKNKVAKQEEVPTIQAGRIPPFVSVTKIMKLGFDWEIQYVIKREAPLNGGIRIEIPLLDDEYVLSDSVQVQDKKAIVSLGENQDTLTWNTKLKISPNIVLKAMNDPAVQEIWQLEAINQWHCTFEGIPIIHQKNPSGRWFPTWYPWPGETLNIHVVKPQAVPGNTLTIDNSRLNVTPGKRATDNVFNFVARSSLGGTHTIKVPANTLLQDVQINGQSQPINAKDGEISLPLHPGSQSVMVKWQSSMGINSYFATPIVDLQIPSSNALIDMKLSKDRWILFLGGPAIGPAVLFWGMLLIVLVVSIGLGRIKSIPLNALEWFLLGIGLCVATPLSVIFVIAWFFAMYKRKEVTTQYSDISFKVIQVSLGFLTLLFVVSLFTSISNGLLGTPQMQLGAPYIDNIKSLTIFSNTYDLQWYQDMTQQTLPHAWVVSLPLYVYRILMLLWALWLAFSLIKWLQWGWQCMSINGLWRKTTNLPEVNQNKE